MKAIVFDAPGDESVLRLAEVPAPPGPAPGEIRIQVEATSINRADLLQREGRYPPPPGASAILGLECAGRVAEVGAGVTRFRAGDRVMALLPGGGYASEAVVHAGCAIAVPDGFSNEEAGAFVEVFLTAWLGLFRLGGLQPGGTALVHGGGSGVGTAAIRLAKAAGARILVTVGSPEKARRCVELGADAAIDYRREDFAERALTLTEGRGVPAILDSIGAPYLERNLRALAVGGRLVVIGLMGGSKSEIDLRALLTRRQQVIGSTLRARAVEEKASLIAAFLEEFGSHLAAGRLRPVIDRGLPIERVTEGHRAMRASEHFGKIALRVP